MTSEVTQRRIYRFSSTSFRGSSFSNAWLGKFSSIQGKIAWDLLVPPVFLLNAYCYKQRSAIIAAHAQSHAEILVLTFLAPLPTGCDFFLGPHGVSFLKSPDGSVIHSGFFSSPLLLFPTSRWNLLLWVQCSFTCKAIPLINYVLRYVKWRNEYNVYFPPKQHCNFDEIHKLWPSQHSTLD